MSDEHNANTHQSYINPFLNQYSLFTWNCLIYIFQPKNEKRKETKEKEMFSNQTIFSEKDDKNEPEDVTDAVRPTSKPSPQGIVSVFIYKIMKIGDIHLKELLTTQVYTFLVPQNASRNVTVMI